METWILSDTWLQKSSTKVFGNDSMACKMWFILSIGSMLPSSYFLSLSSCDCALRSLVFECIFVHVINIFDFQNLVMSFWLDCPITKKLQNSTRANSRLIQFTTQSSNLQPKCRKVQFHLKESFGDLPEWPSQLKPTKRVVPTTTTPIPKSYKILIVRRKFPP